MDLLDGALLEEKMDHHDKVKSQFIHLIVQTFFVSCLFGTLKIYGKIYLLNKKCVNFNQISENVPNNAQNTAPSIFAIAS